VIPNTANPVIAVPSDALDAAGAVESVASLPETFRVGASGRPRVGVVRGTGWMQDALDELGRGSDGILVVPSAGATDPAAVAALRQSSRPVVIDDRWSHNPGVATLAAALAGIADAELLELSAHIDEDDDLADAFIDLVVLADQLAGPLESIDPASTGAEVMNATGVAAGSRGILVSVRRSAVGPGSARIRAVGRSQAVDAVLPDPSTAAPATVRLHGSDGVIHCPTVFESSHRAAWRVLADAVHAGADLPDVSRRTRVVTLLGPEVLPETPSKTGTPAGPANPEEKK
jgi:hypothetical protein